MIDTLLHNPAIQVTISERPTQLALDSVLSPDFQENLVSSLFQSPPHSSFYHTSNRISKTGSGSCSAAGSVNTVLIRIESGLDPD